MTPNRCTVLGRRILNTSAHWEPLMKVNKTAVNMVETSCTTIINPTVDADAWPFAQLRRHQPNTVQNRNSHKIGRDIEAGKCMRQDSQVLVLAP